MNVCMVSHSLYESDTRIMQYARALIDRGDSVDVLALRAAGMPRFELLDGVGVYRILARSQNERRPIEYLMQILRFMLVASWILGWRQLKRRYDVVHVHSVPDFLVFAALVPKLLGARIVLDVHDILPEFYASKFHIASDSLLFRALVGCERISAAFADHVIVANEIWRDRMLSRSVPKGKCTAIRNYPDPEIFYARANRNKDGTSRILYPGSLNRHQGLDIAIRAFARVAGRMQGSEFWIYGEGPEKPVLVALRDQLGMAGRVHIHGFLPVAEIAGIMANADLAVVPKRASMGFGNEAASTKIVEFMSLGVPVIASRTRIESLYFNESQVMFVAPDDEIALAAAILQLWQDGGLRHQIAENGLKYVEENSWARRKATYFKVIDRSDWPIVNAVSDAERS